MHVLLCVLGWGEGRGEGQGVSEYDAQCQDLFRLQTVSFQSRSAIVSWNDPALAAGQQPLITEISDGN